MIFWPLELLYPLNDALRQASINAGEDKKNCLRNLPLRPRWRIMIWLKSEYFHWWRWKSWFRQKFIYKCFDSPKPRENKK